MNEHLQHELIELRRLDEEMRSELVRDGTLFDGYAAEMESVHLQHAERLEEIIDEFGWPGISLVGDDGAMAAWLVAQHAISRPSFQHRCLELLSRAVSDQEALPIHEVYLTDRIRFNERRPQVYGTIFDWDEDGQMSPWEIEDVETVDQRRAAVGLPPLATAIEQMRRDAEWEGNSPPEDFAARQRKIEQWSGDVGWL